MHFPLCRTGVRRGHLHPGIHCCTHWRSASAHVNVHDPAHGDSYCVSTHPEIHVTESHRVSSSVTECHRVSPSVTVNQRQSTRVNKCHRMTPFEYHRVTPSVNECHRMLPSITDYHRVATSATERHRVLLYNTKCDRVLLSVNKVIESRRRQQQVSFCLTK